ncbi:MAG: hypothetical protein IPN19_10405 [Elusimicrobia bacterium]|nr:hypothetical protein [Elusimicrobiota bacterium]
MKSGRVGLVALEGSAEPIELQPFVDFPHRKAMEMVADLFLKENRISGPIHAAITAEGRLPRMLGIEDPLHYEANVKAVRDSAPRQVEMRRLTRTIQAEIDQQKKTVFSPALLDLDRTVTDYRNEKISLGIYLETLAGGEANGVGLGKFPAVRDFLRALGMERSLDFARVETERGRLIEKLTQALSADEITSLMNESMAYRAGQRRFADFYSELNALCQKKNIQLSEFPAMSSYIRYVLLADRINPELLMSEMVELEKYAVAQIARTGEEKALAQRSRVAWLAGRLADFALTPAEWAEWAAAGENSGLDLSTFESFYREALARDGAMAENLWAATNPGDVAVLVTGGFHGDGLARELGRRGVTVVSYVPKIEKVDTAQGAAYLSVFSQEKTPLEKLFRGEKLFLGANSIAPEVRRIALPAAAVLAAISATAIGILAGFDFQLAYAGLGGVGAMRDVTLTLGAAQAVVGVGAGALLFKLMVNGNGGGALEIYPNREGSWAGSVGKVQRYWDKVKTVVTEEMVGVVKNGKTLTFWRGFFKSFQGRVPTVVLGLFLPAMAGVPYSWLIFAPALFVVLVGQIVFLADHGKMTLRQWAVRAVGILLLNGVAFLGPVMMGGMALGVAPETVGELVVRVGEGIGLAVAAHLVWNGIAEWGKNKLWEQDYRLVGGKNDSGLPENIHVFSLRFRHVFFRSFQGRVPTVVLGLFLPAMAGVPYIWLIFGPALICVAVGQIMFLADQGVMSPWQRVVRAVGILLLNGVAFFGPVMMGGMALGVAPETVGELVVRFGEGIGLAVAAHLVWNGIAEWGKNNKLWAKDYRLEGVKENSGLPENVHVFPLKSSEEITNELQRVKDLSDENRKQMIVVVDQGDVFKDEFLSALLSDVDDDILDVLFGENLDGWTDLTEAIVVGMDGAELKLDKEVEGISSWVNRAQGVSFVMKPVNLLFERPVFQRYWLLAHDPFYKKFQKMFAPEYLGHVAIAQILLTYEGLDLAKGEFLKDTFFRAYLKSIASGQNHPNVLALVRKERIDMSANDGTNQEPGSNDILRFKNYTPADDPFKQLVFLCLEWLKSQPAAQVDLLKNPQALNAFLSLFPAGITPMHDAAARTFLLRWVLAQFKSPPESGDQLRVGAALAKLDRNDVLLFAEGIWNDGEPHLNNFWAALNFVDSKFVGWLKNKLGDSSSDSGGGSPGSVSGTQLLVMFLITLSLAVHLPGVLDAFSFLEFIRPMGLEMGGQAGALLFILNSYSIYPDRSQTFGFSVPNDVHNAVTDAFHRLVYDYGPWGEFPERKSRSVFDTMVAVVNNELSVSDGTDKLNAELKASASIGWGIYLQEALDNRARYNPNSERKPVDLTGHSPGLPAQYYVDQYLEINPDKGFELDSIKNGLNGINTRYRAQILVSIVNCLKAETLTIVALDDELSKRTNFDFNARLRAPFYSAVKELLNFTDNDTLQGSGNDDLTTLRHPSADGGGGKGSLNSSLFGTFDMLRPFMFLLPIVFVLAWANAPIMFVGGAVLIVVGLGNNWLGGISSILKKSVDIFKRLYNRIAFDAGENILSPTQLAGGLADVLDLADQGNHQGAAERITELLRGVPEISVENIFGPQGLGELEAITESRTFGELEFQNQFQLAMRKKFPNGITLPRGRRAVAGLAFDKKAQVSPLSLGTDVDLKTKKGLLVVVTEGMVKDLAKRMDSFEKAARGKPVYWAAENVSVVEELQKIRPLGHVFLRPSLVEREGAVVIVSGRTLEQVVKTQPILQDFAIALPRDSQVDMEGVSKTSVLRNVIFYFLDDLLVGVKLKFTTLHTIDKIARRIAFSA